MIETGDVLAAVEAAASNPKVATTVATGTTLMGGMMALDQIQTFVGTVSVIIGCVVGVFVILVHSMKYKLLKRAWDQGELPKDL